MKNINMGCKSFKELNLDLYIEVTNAPGLSAFNKVERKMFHLSKELTGVLLPHASFGQCWKENILFFGGGVPLVLLGVVWVKASLGVRACF